MPASSLWLLFGTLTIAFGEVRVVEKNIAVLNNEVTDEIISLGYPNSAGIEDKQIWHLTAEPNAKIELTCEDLRISPSDNCEKGYFEVDDGENSQKYCGSESMLTTISRNNTMTVVFQLIWASGVAKCTAKGLADENREVSIPEDIGNIHIPLGSPAYDKIYYYALPKRLQKSWLFTTDSNAKISIFCGRLGFLYGRPCDKASLKIGEELLCGTHENYTKISTGNSLNVEITMGKFDGGDIDCIVQAVNGPHVDQYRNVGSMEIDSSEHGGPPKGKGTTCPCGYTNKTQDAARIVNGNEVEDGKYPWMAILKNSGGHFCGGSVITEYHILTAAHCTVNKDINTFTVTVGTNNRLEGGQTIAIKKKDDNLYDKNQLHVNDISVLTLVSKIEFGDKVGPVCLTPTRPDFDHKYIIVMGWGYLGEEGGWKHPKILQRAYMKVVDHTTCSFHWYRRFNTASQDRMCTWATNRDSCNGDSGGPLVWLDTEINRYQQVGIVSFGKGCNTNYPKVNTLVPHFYTWIERIISEHPEYPKGVNICRKKE